MKRTENEWNMKRTVGRTEIWLSVMLVMALMPVTLKGQDLSITSTAGGWTYASGLHTIINDGAYTIEMTTPSTTTTTDRIVVAGGVTADITLNGVSIDRSADVSNSPTACAFNIVSNFPVNLTLLGNNTLKSGNALPGLYAASSKILTITAASTGALSAFGGNNAAGIGGDMGGTPGNITINGGTINATGGSGGAGIGGGLSGAGGTTVINGGTVTAIGGTGAAGIDGGAGGSGINSMTHPTAATVTAPNTACPQR